MAGSIKDLSVYCYERAAEEVENVEIENLIKKVAYLQKIFAYAIMPVGKTRLVAKLAQSENPGVAAPGFSLG